jgi:hypothetical protein
VEDSESDFEPCGLCGRPLVPGPSINRHHLVPKTFKGREAVSIHRICHSKIHSVFTERELANHYHTFERLLTHEEILKFVKWVRKKDPEMYSKNRTTRAKRQR